MPCPKCKTEGTKDTPITDGGAVIRYKVECVKCSRFIGWRDAAAKIPIPLPADSATSAPVAAIPTTSIDEVGSPQAWLYVSRRLDLAEVPNEPFWAVPAFTGGMWSKPVAYYRLSARVLVWLEAAGAVLEQRMHESATGREAVMEFVKHMLPVWEFAGRHISPEAVRAARLLPPSLPESPAPK